MPTPKRKDGRRRHRRAADDSIEAPRDDQRKQRARRRRSKEDGYKESSYRDEDRKRKPKRRGKPAPYEKLGERWQQAGGAVLADGAGVPLADLPAGQTMETEFDRLNTGGVLPPMTGGAIFADGWKTKSKQDAVDTVDLYKRARNDGAARTWVGNTPDNLRLSAQALQNWAHAKRGNAFNGLIDARTGEIFLVPATKRGASTGVPARADANKPPAERRDGQRAWKSSELKKQRFHKNQKLAPGNLSPLKHGKLGNVNHSLAATLLEGKNTPLDGTATPFEHFKEEQEVNSNYLGFFVHTDAVSGELVLNHKSAQLNAPNLTLPAYDSSELFHGNDNHLTASLPDAGDSDIKQQRAKLTQLPPDLQKLVVEAMSDLSDKPPNRWQRLKNFVKD